MMRHKIFTVFVCLISGLFCATAQDLPLTHFMRLNPHQLSSDLTANLQCNGYVSVPLLGSTNAGIYNNALNYNKMFKQDSEGYPTTFTAGKFVNSLAEYNNTISADINEEVLGFGFRLKEKYFLSFNYNIRANAAFSFSKDLPGFLLMGNMAYAGDGNEADMRIDLQGTAFQEFGFAFQHKVNEHWTWGVRPKLLFGAFQVQTQSCQIQAHTDPDNYNLAFNYGVQARLASCMPLMMDLNNGNYDFELGDFSRNVIGNAFRNAGCAIDLGVRYTPAPKFGISLSVLDLGFIHWNTNVYQIENENTNAEGLGALQFSGLNNEDVNLFTSEGGIKQMLDSIADYFPLSSAPSTAYSTMLHTRLQAQFDYTITPSNRLSLVASGNIYNHSLHPSLTIAYNGTFFNIIDVCVAYTMQKRSYDNLALGLGFNLGPINLFFATHNLIPVFSHTSLKKVNASVGLVINWGHRAKKNEDKQKADE